MGSKYELTISTNYVPDWTYIEAMRELFQNALDNEIANPENKMRYTFDNGVFTLSNKTSVLPIESLLLGCSTKRDDENTIGKHGEGYKIAFMVLLREGKQIKVYNYGKREIWEANLVKSRRFNGELVPIITVHKNSIWEKVPSDDLSIEVSGMTMGEFREIREKNLNIKDHVEYTEVYRNSKILTDQSKEAGNIYVKGLFICKKEELSYGYDFDPSLISLDRDRKLVQDFDVKWNASQLWSQAFSKGMLREELLELVKCNAYDVTYIENNLDMFGGTAELSNMVAEMFIKDNGKNATPISCTDDINEAIENGLKPVLVGNVYASIIKKSISDDVVKFEKKTLKEKFQDFMQKVESKLTDEELQELDSLIQEL